MVGFAVVEVSVLETLDGEPVGGLKGLLQYSDPSPHQPNVEQHTLGLFDRQVPLPTFPNPHGSSEGEFLVSLMQ